MTKRQTYIDKIKPLTSRFSSRSFRLCMVFPRTSMVSFGSLGTSSIVSLFIFRNVSESDSHCDSVRRQLFNHSQLIEQLSPSVVRWSREVAWRCFSVPPPPGPMRFEQAETAWGNWYPCQWGLQYIESAHLFHSVHRQLLHTSVHRHIWVRRADEAFWSVVIKARGEVK